MKKFRTAQNLRGDHRFGDARSNWRDLKPERHLRGSLWKVLPVFWILLVASVSPAYAGGIGGQAPDFSLPALSGGKIGLEAYRGKVVLLNFWASWYSPCKEELPELERLQQNFQIQGFEVLGINIDKRRKNASKLVARFGLSFTVLLDPDAEVIQRYPGRAMPISYLIDREGTIRKVFFGFNPSKRPQMQVAIKEVLDEKKR